jgi:hypothetical protein
MQMSSITFSWDLLSHRKNGAKDLRYYTKHAVCIAYQ